MSVYEDVRRYINAVGLQQGTVAQKAGISLGTFQAIMNGERTMDANDLRAICLALNVRPERFIDVEKTCPNTPQTIHVTAGKE